ncbi:hypothetical protein [Parageobacillus thermoglucosidasius]|uniref:hypothetical protein n=1 Tax=Parageobacillus thermoglucosidasius TaxID=1426 RepID=UPI000B54B582|nr:hypothetical protein [Parageobacillus thermoglucosidasius]MBY6269486.1 hypothetical protein [Parageobacillus thermoglucosidasius]OUM87561.1 MAG: hypothetical protein BAA00_04125 [Parageobacillus thermoglucosidasius]
MFRWFKLFKNDTVEYINQLVEAYGGIDGYRKKIELAKHLSQTHDEETITLMKNELRGFYDLLKSYTQLFYTITNVFLTITFSIFAAFLGLYFDVVMEKLKENVIPKTDASQLLLRIGISTGVLYLF